MQICKSSSVLYPCHHQAITANGKTYSALEVASEYFRSGADKISIGSDAVDQAETYRNSGGKLDGTSRCGAEV
eukprot:361335-Chlamydomonas_euryale.AAC.4